MAHAFPCKNQTGKEVARRLWNNFLVYGFPHRIHSDQGANFESKLIKELLEMAWIQKSHTTPYHPMGNGVAERFNRTLGDMIRSLPPQPKAKWPQLLQLLTFCYNCTEHETTGFAPFYLVFGRIPHLPVDMMFQDALTNDTVVSYSDFVSHLKKDPHEAAQIVQKNSLKEQTRHAKIYNHKIKGSPLVIGVLIANSRVLIANRRVPGKRKVISILKRIVHRNLLLPVSFMPCESVENYESDCDYAAAMQGSGQCPDLPDVMENSDVRTIDWLKKSDVDGIHSDDGNSTERESCAAQSDSLSVVTSSRAGHLIPVHNIGHSAVNDVEDPGRCPDILPPDMLMIPTSSVHPDMTPPGEFHVDLPLPVSNPLDVEITPVIATPDGDCPDLPQTVSTELGTVVPLGPPRRLNQAVDETALSAVSVRSLIQFFSSVLSV